jgi:hypothetical protein
MASLIGLGDVIDCNKIRKTLKSIYKFNWRSSLKDHPNMQRVYALNDEAGLILCTWPRGGRPKTPFPYSDEVWTGFEYQVASHLFYEGFIKEGLSIVKGARDRHDGFRRNPWDEFECGHHYARAMSAYGLLLALSGFKFDVGVGMIGFEPRLSVTPFRTFWSLDGCWGEYEQQTGKSATVSVAEGSLTLKVLLLPQVATNRSVVVDDGRKKQILPADSDGKIILPKPVTIRRGKQVSISIH